MLPSLNPPHPLQPVPLQDDGVAPTRDFAVLVNGRQYPVELWRRYLLVFSAATLSCTVVLKIAEIQYLELIFAADLLVLCLLLVWDQLRFRVFRPFLKIAGSYAIFLVCAFMLSLFSLQQDFSYSFHASALKAPVLVTLARMAELFLDAFYMLYLAALYRDDEKLCIFGLKTYFWTGIVGCLYSFATFPLNVLFLSQYGTYTDRHRFRGFDNEGGGFGLYILSVMLIAAFMYRRGWLSRTQYRVGMPMLIVGFVGSQSKSAYIAVGMLGMIILVWFVKGRRRWAALSALTIGLVILGSLIDIRGQVDQYRVGAERYEELSNLKWADGNYVMGRVAGAVLAPRMIAARPLLGIGWGNYPLVRDDVDYRQGTAFAIGSVDAPSLGVIDYIVELGIPLWLYLTWVELKPVFMLRRRGAGPWLIALALIQPISNWSGAHLNLMHPWVVVAFALGLAYRAPTRETLSPEVSVA